MYTYAKWISVDKNVEDRRQQYIRRERERLEQGYASVYTHRCILCFSPYTLFILCVCAYRAYKGSMWILASLSIHTHSSIWTNAHSMAFTLYCRIYCADTLYILFRLLFVVSFEFWVWTQQTHCCCYFQWLMHWCVCMYACMHSCMYVCMYVACVKRTKSSGFVFKNSRLVT